MQVRLLVTVSGTRDGQAWPPAGNTMELPDEEARQMIAAEQAIPVSQHRAAETGTLVDSAVETRQAHERPLTTETGPVPARKGASK